MASVPAQTLKQNAPSADKRCFVTVVFDVDNNNPNDANTSATPPMRNMTQATEA